MSNMSSALGSSLAADFWATSMMLAAGLHGHLERLDGFGATHEQRDHHVREDHHVAQGQQRQIHRQGRQGFVFLT